MELKALLRFLIRKSWIILPILGLTIAATVYFTNQQTPLYTANATYIMRLNSQLLDSRGSMTALDVFNRNTEIQSTYSEVAMSNKITNSAAARLGFDQGAPKNYKVNSRALTGTNILEITVQGPNPDITSFYANTIGEETVNYVNNLYSVYILESLDPATPPLKPSFPNSTLNYALGALLGLFLGLGIALLASYLSTPTKYKGNVQEFDYPASMGDDISDLEEEFKTLRAQMDDTRVLIKTTEMEARSLRRTIHSLANRYPSDPVLPSDRKPIPTTGKQTPS